MKSRTQLSRRQFLSLTAMASGGLLAAANPISLLAAQDSLTLELWHGWTGADNTDALNGVIDVYNSSNEDNVTIAPTALGWEDLFSKWTVAAAAGNPPDIVMHHVNEVQEYASRDQIIPLDDLVGQSGLDLSELPETAIEASKYDGNLYSIPGDTYSLGMYYNVDLVEAAGLDPSTPPSTRDEFLEWAEAMTIRDGAGNISQYGADISVTGPLLRWLWFSLLYQLGGTFLGEDGLTAVNSQASQDALQFLYDLVYTHEFGSGGSTDDAINAFSSGRVAMQFTGSWVVNLYTNEQLNFATAPLPVMGNTMATWADSHVQSLPRQNDEAHYEAGMNYIKWFFDNYALPAKEVGIIPLSPTSRNSAEFVDDPRYIHYQAFVDSIPFGVVEPSLTNFTEIFGFSKPTPLTQNLEAAMTQQKSIEQALNDMKEGIDATLNIGS